MNGRTPAGPRFRVSLTLELTPNQMDEIGLEWRHYLPKEATLRQQIRQYLGLKVITARIEEQAEDPARVKEADE